MAQAVIKQHDRRPYLRVALLDGADAPFPVGGSETIAFLFRPVTNLALVLRATGYVITETTSVPGSDGELVTVTQLMEHRWLTSGAPWPGSTHHTGLAGLFDFEVEHQNVAGEPRTFPVVEYNTLIVYDDVDYP